ncbi:hypothetical protein CsSME_00014934 [Camellia sinensis var. sinensis]
MSQVRVRVPLLLIVSHSTRKSASSSPLRRRRRSYSGELLRHSNYSLLPHSCHSQFFCQSIKCEAVGKNLLLVAVAWEEFAASC